MCFWDRVKQRFAVLCGVKASSQLTSNGKSWTQAPRLTQSPLLGKLFFNRVGLLTPLHAAFVGINTCSL